MSVTAVPIQPVKKGYLVWLWLGIIAALVAAYALARVSTYDPNTAFLSSNGARKGVVTTASGLQYEVLEPGNGGAKPTDNDVALIEYVGKDIAGEEFDRSQQPTPLPVAPGATVKGFSEALHLMPRGAKYRFWIKPELGYGEKRADGQVPPPDSPQAKLAKKVLVFDVTMLDFISRAEFLQRMQMQQQMMGGAGGPGGAPGQGAPGEGAPGE